ncbi:MAG: DUF4184 family protein [Candidatus Thorarchaeota archaeon]|nr:DUF4184 family protein [Candidatus Thorarchaeota archaeon]
MPLTPLHYPAAYIMKRAFRRLPLPALVVGAVIPDVEVPILVIFFPSLPDHLLLHSLIGAFTIGLLLAVIVTRYLYTPIITTIFKVDRNDLSEQCRITPLLVLACALGILSHLLLDFPMHPFNPLFWPWISPYALPGPLLVFFGQGDLSAGYRYAALLYDMILIPMWLIILYVHRREKLWTRIWANLE